MKEWLEVAGIVVGILATLFGAAYFLGCRLFATRKELHTLQNNDAALNLALEAVKNDVAWLKNTKPKR